MRFRQAFALTLLCVFSGLCGCASKSPQTTVVWISIDAFRGDYLQRFHPPTLTRLAREGAFTTQEVPVFPSLTFPNHIAQATGTTVDRNGVPMNHFYDMQTRQSYDQPDDGSAIRSEPIWITAKRQGIHVAVIDWPMSHQQTGRWRSDYFLDRYDTQQTDQQRLDRVAQILKTDSHRHPLRLVMSYISNVDTVGHRNGPNSPEIELAVLEADREVDGFLKSVTAWFDSTHSSKDDLIVLLTTDHGMEPVHTLVNLDRLIGADLAQGARIVTSGPIACIYLDEVQPELQDSRASQIVSKLQSNQFLSAWVAKDVPERFHFSDPSRIGQVVVLLSPGHNFTSLKIAATQPALAGLRGSHGYDPADCPDMLGTAIVWRYRHPLDGKDFGRVDNTQWHATVANWLGITRSPESDSRVIRIPE